MLPNMPQGVDEEHTGLIPRWKRGHFSVLFDAGATPVT